MTGGLIELVAKGMQDIFLTHDPQITFFKIVYRRHTNFSTEPIKQYFLNTPNFGKTATCLISKNGDLMGKTYIVIVLPKLNQYTKDGKLDPITKSAWVRKVGYALINSIEIEIGGQVIDRHYSEWLNIWAEMTQNKTEQYNKMIGNIREIYDFTNGKDEYTLQIPLSFWFCRSYGLALPLVSLQYCDVKINVTINDLDKCFLVTPTHYIEVENDLVNFKQFEYIEQNIDGTIASGLFSHYDEKKKRLYYSRISRNKFQAMPINESTNPEVRRQLVYNSTNSKFWIKSFLGGAFAMPKFNIQPQVHSYNKLRNISIKDCYLIIDYVFLDEDERKKFVNSRHDYLIEQLNYIGEKTIEGSHRKIKFDSVQPSKLMVWVAQYSYLLEKYNNDLFNYTDNYKYEQKLIPRKNFLTGETGYEPVNMNISNHFITSNKLIGKSLVTSETIEFNGQERLSKREHNYFNYIQSQLLSNGIAEGINLYCFGLFPEKICPSGSANLGQIDNVNITLDLSADISVANDVKFRGYSLETNIYRIVSGIGGLAFTR